MKKPLFIIMLSAALALSGYGQTKTEDISRLLEVTNVKAQAAQMFDLMMPALQAMAPDVPEAFWTMFREKLDMESYVALFIPVYDRHFSHDEIKALLRFYETPAGKKFVEATPMIAQESFAIGEAWGQKIGTDVFDELVRQGYE